MMRLGWRRWSASALPPPPAEGSQAGKPDGGEGEGGGLGHEIDGSHAEADCAAHARERNNDPV